MSKFKHRVPYSPSQKLNQLSDIPTYMEIGEPPSPIEAVSPIFKGDRWVFPTTSTDTDENLNLGKISPPNFASTPKKDMLNSSIDSDKTEIYTYDFEQGNITLLNLSMLKKSAHQVLDLTVYKSLVKVKIQVLTLSMTRFQEKAKKGEFCLHLLENRALQKNLTGWMKY